MISPPPGIRRPSYNGAHSDVGTRRSQTSKALRGVSVTSCPAPAPLKNSPELKTYFTAWRPNARGRVCPRRSTGAPKPDPLRRGDDALLAVRQRGRVVVRVAVFAVFAVWRRSDQIITGTAITLLALPIVSAKFEKEVRSQCVGLASFETPKKLGLVIDLDTCVGCHACAVACKEWNAGGFAAPLLGGRVKGRDSARQGLTANGAEGRFFTAQRSCRAGAFR